MLRIILRDRFLAGAWALALACFLIAQAAISGFGTGMMAGAAASPFEIICTSGSDQAASGHGDHDPAGGKAMFDCCGTLCRMAAASLAAALVPDVVPFDWPRVPNAAALTQTAETVAQPPFRGLSGAPRAPPAFS